MNVTPPSKALTLFMRYPEAGAVKSRLAAAVGERESARVYGMLVRRMLGVAADFKRKRPDVDAFIFFTPTHRKADVERAYRGPWEFLPQSGDHLGERMARAMHQLMAKGYTQVLLVGTDLADVEARDFETAFKGTEAGDAVLGPARDGGFYAIGLDRPCPSAFESPVWGRDDVFQRTEQRLKASGFRVRRLTIRNDIDRPEDLKLLQEQSCFHDRLSVIVPTLSPIERLKPFLLNLEALLWPDDEIIVVRGDTREGELPEQVGARIRCLRSPRGRGRQFNAGARAARGTLLLFLHDDTGVPGNFAHAVRKISEASGSSLGCFQLAFAPSTPLLDWIARWANLRTRAFGLPYGDQGLFCRRHVFETLGGFHKPYLMEDVDFVRRCKRVGGLMVLPDTLTTSPRRYLRRGVLRTGLQNHLLMLLYRLGVSDRTLYSLYYGRGA